MKGASVPRRRKGRTFGARQPEGNYVQVFGAYPKFREIQNQLDLE